MAAIELLEVSVDADLKKRVEAILTPMGLTVSDALQILLTRIADDCVLLFDTATEPEGYDAWVRAKVQEALDDPRPPIPEEEADAYMDRWCVDLLRRSEAGVT